MEAIPVDVLKKLEDELDGDWLISILPVKEDAKFPKDEGSEKKCRSCEGNCCFLTYPYKISRYSPYPDFEKLKEFYKNPDALKNAIENMFGSDFWDNTRLNGNRDWFRILYNKKTDKYYVGFACPALNAKAKCSIYPDRPSLCKNSDGGIYHQGQQVGSFCDLKVVFENKPDEYL